MNPKKYSVFIVDDHPLVRRGYSYVVGQHPKLHICGEASSVDEALKKIRESAPDLVITDISLEGATGLELIKSLQVEYPSLPILVISMHDESEYAFRSFRSGARGYIVKRKGDSTIVQAIETLLQGGVYLSDEMTRSIVTELQGNSNGKITDPIDNLTDREMEIFQLCGQGLSFREISESLHISIKTVESHRSKIRNKINATSNVDLIRKAVQWVSRGRYERLSDARSQ